MVRHGFRAKQLREAIVGVISSGQRTRTAHGGIQMNAQPAGWYPDPIDASQLRYWSGSAWTEHRSPRGQAPTPAWNAHRAPAPPVPTGKWYFVITIASVGLLAAVPFFHAASRLDRPQLRKVGAGMAAGGSPRVRTDGSVPHRRHRSADGMDVECGRAHPAHGHGGGHAPLDRPQTGGLPPFGRCRAALRQPGRDGEHRGGTAEEERGTKACRQGPDDGSRAGDWAPGVEAGIRRRWPAGAELCIGRAVERGVWPTAQPLRRKSWQRAQPWGVS